MRKERNFGPKILLSIFPCCRPNVLKVVTTLFIELMILISIQNKKYAILDFKGLHSVVFPDLPGKFVGDDIILRTFKKISDRQLILCCIYEFFDRSNFKCFVDRLFPSQSYLKTFSLNNRKKLKKLFLRYHLKSKIKSETKQYDTNPFANSVKHHFVRVDGSDFYSAMAVHED